MEFRKVSVLRGPNIWANFPVIEAWVELGEWADRLTSDIPDLNDRLINWLPSMVEHRCSTGERGGFFDRLRRGTHLAHVLQHVTLELQFLAGVDVAFGRARETSEPGVHQVIFKYRDETLARECLDAARDLVMAAATAQPFDVAATVERLREVAERNLFGPSTDSIVQAAWDRNIPSIRLNEYSLVQLGYGARQRRIRAAETDRTGAMAEAIAQDKELTRRLLSAAGIPVAAGRPVKDAEDAWEAAEEIGVPVVVKPQDGNQGRGVTTNITTKEQVIAAYQAALNHSSDVIVEKYAPGNDYRLLVIGGRLIAASRREPAQVMGDGRHTIRELVDLANQDPRRGEHHANVLSKIKIDEIALNVLRDQHYTPETVLPAGEIALIRRNANLSTGGTAIDVTDQVHPEVAARAIEAAKVVGLDIAGIDVVASDITVPLEKQGGIVVEVNAAPGLRMHLAPAVGERREVGKAIIDMLFPGNETGRIPIAAITGTNGKTTVTRFIAHILKETGKRVGMTCTDGIYVDGRRIDADDCSGPVSARNVLMNPMVDAAVFETARGGILRAGLGFDECDVAVVTNVGEGDHLGLNDINTPEDLAKVKRTIVDVVSPSGTAVLNANDPLVADMAPHCPGRVLYFALNPEHPVIAEHRAAGGCAIFVRKRTIVIAEGEREHPVMAMKRVPLTFGGRIAFEVENALAAIGAAWSMGVPIGSIVLAAETFSTNEANVPGRFNIHEMRGATVIVDYGHNADALRAMVNAIETFPHKRRTALYSMAGDRRDKDIVVVGRMLGDAFDRVILYEAHTVRGREPGEISNLMRRGLADGSRVRNVEAIDGSIKSMEYALDTVEPGELLLLQADYIDETVDFVSEYLEKLRACDERHSHFANVWDFDAALHRVRVANRPAVRIPVSSLDVCTGMMAEAPFGAKIW